MGKQANWLESDPGQIKVTKTISIIIAHMFFDGIKALISQSAHPDYRTNKSA